MAGDSDLFIRCLQLHSFVSNMGVMLQGAAKVIALTTGNAFSPNNIVIAMTVAFLLYSFFGGLIASAYTNMIQAVLIIVLSMLLIPFGLHELGGFSAHAGHITCRFF